IRPVHSLDEPDLLACAYPSSLNLLVGLVVRYFSHRSAAIYYAAFAALEYLEGCRSNAVRHSSEQKEYFLPAYWVSRSVSCSSTSRPQIGSIVTMSTLLCR